MAFLRKQRKGRAVYYYIVQNRRRGGKVVQRVCEYLGRDPDPKRLKRALRYWGVKAKPVRRERR
jgi:hypothetical protein